MRNNTKQLVLNKGSEKFIFLYESGRESELLDAIAEQAANCATGFDWFDAAVLSFRLTQSLIGEADRLLHKDMPDAMQSFYKTSTGKNGISGLTRD